jgi:hypothetical protein
MGTKRSSRAANPVQNAAASRPSGASTSPSMNAANAPSTWSPARSTLSVISPRHAAARPRGIAAGAGFANALGKEAQAPMAKRAPLGNRARVEALYTCRGVNQRLACAPASGMMIAR